MENILEIHGVDVEFPGVKALDNVDFELRPGEIHAIVGENGAGKSTLMKVLTGVNTPSKGKIIFENKDYDSFTIEEAQQHGISMIYQELNLVSELSIYQNVFLGNEISRNGRIARQEMIQETKRILKSLNIELNPEMKLGNMSVAYQQMVEIAKSLLTNPKVLIMDEPTAPLTDTEVNILFGVIKALKEQGVAIIYISHRLEEIFEVCDRCTVFRDGQSIIQLNVEETNVDELIYHMVGRELDAQYPDKLPLTTGELNLPILEVRNIKNDKLKNISFSLKKGEILGIGGLVGAGRTELLRAIFGKDKYSGEIFKNNQQIVIKTPEDAIHHNIALVPENRKRDGLILNMDVATNIMMPILAERKKGLFFDRARIKDDVNQSIDSLNIKTPSAQQMVKFLSGGNQQKVIISRWLLSNTDVFLFDEPTRGIDVGAKYEIYVLLNELKELGKSIIMVSSDMPELISMSDRILVMSEGALTGEITEEDEFNQEIIMKYAANIQPKIGV